VPGWSRNNGSQPHQVAVFQLQGLSLDELKEAAANPAAGASKLYEELGGLAAIAAGTEGWAVADLPAGDYAFLCLQRDEKSGSPHAALGMIKAVTVR